MAESCASFWLMPPSSAGASSYEDKANSYTHDGYSAALDHGLAAPRVGDGDARHIAMKSIRMRQRKSMSPINSYAESNKGKLWRETAAGGHPSPLLENLNFLQERHLWTILYISSKWARSSQVFSRWRTELPSEIRRIEANAPEDLPVAGRHVDAKFAKGRECQ